MGPLPVLLPAPLAASVRAFLAGDSAVVSLVVDLGPDVDPAARYAAVHRAPDGASAGNFLVLGGLADPDAANLLALNARALGLVTGRCDRTDGHALGDCPDYAGRTDA